jgi:uncharacterized membrane protein YheB (UPF0754 family)
MPTAARRKAAEAKARAAEENVENLREEQDEADAKKAAELIGTTSKPKAKPAKGELFINNSSDNVFTTVGRCGPGGTVELDPEEAKNYKGLEPCRG